MSRGESHFRDADCRRLGAVEDRAGYVRDCAPIIQVCTGAALRVIWPPSGHLYRSCAAPNPVRTPPHNPRTAATERSSNALTNIRASFGLHALGSALTNAPLELAAALDTLDQLDTDHIARARVPTAA